MSGFMDDISWIEFLAYHWRKVLGGVIGFLVALILVVFGFWKGFFILFCAALGVFVGWHLDVGDGFRHLWELFRSQRR